MDSLTPLRLSLSQAYTLRYYGVGWVQEGVQSDPRTFYTPQFQLLSPDATSFGAWHDGQWETNPPASPPSSGPFAATIVVGAGQPAELNPAATGVYFLWIRYLGASDTPAFRARRPLEFAAP